MDIKNSWTTPFRTTTSDTRSLSLTKSALLVLSAFAFLLLFQAKVPLHPVPITLQTLGLSLMALWWPRREALYATLSYLAAASVGLPVLSGWESNALWLLTPKAGFLLGFPLFVWTVGYLASLRTSVTLVNSCAILLAGQVVLHLCGLSCLALYVPMQQLLAVGLFPFLPGLLYKTAAAVCCDKAVAKFY